MTTPNSPFSDRDIEDKKASMFDYLAQIAASAAIRRVRETAWAAWQPESAHRVLDAGCGIGEVARELVTRISSGGEVVALDHAAAMIDEARRRHDGSRVIYQVGDITDLPFPDASFDAVRSERVLQHLAQPDRAVAELRRVLRPGGRICLIDTDWGSLLFDGSPAGFAEQAEIAIAAGFAGITADGRPATSGRGLRRRLVTAGFTQVRAEPVTLVFTNRAELQLIFPVGRDSFLYTRAAPEARPQIESWFEAFDQAEADGTLLTTLTMWVATGVRPE